MRSVCLFLLCLALVFLFSADSLWAASSYENMRIRPSPTPVTVAPREGCRVVRVQCSCINPTRSFVVPRQKLGKRNLYEPGQCLSPKEIDRRAAQGPVAFCMKEGMVKDVRLGETQCKASWSCVEPCQLY